MPRPSTVPGSVPLTLPIDHRSLMLLGTGGAWSLQRDGWTHEVKYDGYRLLAYRIGRETRLLSRNGNELGVQFPELVAALSTIRIDCIFDGELTVCDAAGKPDWHALRPRSAMKAPHSIRTAASARPATLFVFDVLARGKRDLRPMPLSARRLVLEQLVTNSDRVRVVAHYPDGVQLFQSVTAHGLEGVVCKRLDSAYFAGRSKDWLKVRASTAREQSRRS